MTYVEWLRVRNVLRIVAIILAVLVAVQLILRISFNSYITSDDEVLKHVQKQPGTTISHTVLPDGTKRTTIHDPKEDTVVTIDGVSGGGRHIVINEPNKHGKTDLSHATIGSVKVRSEIQGDRVISVVDTNSETPFFYYMIVADVVAFFIATFLAVPFARENDGHLEYALTKPASRVSLGLQLIGVDLAAIVASSLMAVVALLICQSMFEIPHFTFEGVSGQAVGMGIAFPFAWYAMLNAITASMKRGYGAILGFAWPGAFVIILLVLLPLGDSLLGQIVHATAWGISRLIPLSYIDSHFTFSPSGELQSAHGDSFGIRFAIECALFIIYSALALVQWKRVEA